MTWSLLARDASGAFGVAIASRFFAVGSLCPGVVANRGALSTQALMNPLYRRAGLAALAQAIAPDEIVRRVTGEDEGRDVRQFHVLDASGSAAHTGRACIDWCGHVSGPGYSIADIDAYALVDPLRDLAPELVNDARSPRLIDWLSRIAARPAVRAARSRSRSGHPEQAFVPGVESARWG